MNLLLVRHAYLPDVTLGRWYIAGKVFAGLGEPWIPSKHGPGGQRRDIDGKESCIPDGVYAMHPHISAKYPAARYVWFLVNEQLGVYAPGTRPSGQKWGRDAVLAHNGTTTDDILGCELAGMTHGIYNGKPAVFESRAAIAAMRELLKMEVHTLTIRPTLGTQEMAA